jgi:hypothetical protein
MSFLQKATSLFSRHKAETTSDSTPPKETATEPASTEASPTDNVIYIYSHGFTNGVYRVSPDSDSFETFLENGNRLDKIKEQRETTEKAIAETEMKLSAATLSRSADTHVLVEKKHLSEHISASLIELDQHQLKMEQQETSLVTQMQETVSEYPWVPALIYFSVGITFIVADFSITQQITSWGFDMSGWQGSIFAVGLAFTAFLIKPTIDRLLEKPFQASGFKLKTLYTCVLLGITAIGLAMLLFLGKFRSDAERAQSDIKIILEQTNATDPRSPEYAILQKKLADVQKSLDDNPMGQTGLILSGLLFAIGGAICLSLSFGSLKNLMYKHLFLATRIRRIRIEQAKLHLAIAKLRSEHTTTKIERENAEKRLSASEAQLLGEVLKELQEERFRLLTEFYQAQFEKEHALYEDGKNKGGKYEIDGKLTYKVPDSDHSSIHLNKKDGKEDTAPLSPLRPYTRRPFVKMRKMIADNFNKNQSTQAYDGSDFEIVS